MVFDRAGRPLWLGRKQRLGNPARRLAVAIRDGGCFECGAPMHRRELNHMQERHRNRGPTDIENLVAVSRRHHKWLETNNLNSPTNRRWLPDATPHRPRSPLMAIAGGQPNSEPCQAAESHNPAEPLSTVD